MTIASSKDAVVRASQLLASQGLLFRGEHANLSARIDHNQFVMTQGGFVAHLTTNDLAVLDLSGTVIEGDMDPTMQEVIQMHAGVYRTRSSVGAVIHTHSPHLTAFAVAHEEIPLVYEPLLRYGVTEPIPVIAWAPRGSDESVSAILKVVETRPGIPAVLMANHGALVFHEDPLSTARLLASLDEAAELIIMANALGGAQPLDSRAVQAVQERMHAFGSHH